MKALDAQHALAVSHDALRPDPLTLSAVPSSTRPTPRRLRSETLFAGSHEIEIEHGNQLYRMRVTALGKLILTK